MSGLLNSWNLAVLSWNTIINALTKGYEFLQSLVFLVPAQVWGFLNTALLVAVVGFLLGIILKILEVIF